jgi:hypothetical protein
VNEIYYFLLVYTYFVSRQNKIKQKPNESVQLFAERLLNIAEDAYPQAGDRPVVEQQIINVLLYRFHGWLIFARVIALFMFVWLYVRPHILYTQLVICLLSHFIHIWYLGCIRL